MTVYVHFLDQRTPIKQFNVAAIHDLGYSSVTLVNAFGGEPKRFDGVKHVAAEPERSEE